MAVIPLFTQDRCESFGSQARVHGTITEVVSHGPVVSLSLVILVLEIDYAHVLSLSNFMQFTIRHLVFPTDGSEYFTGMSTLL